MSHGAPNMREEYNDTIMFMKGALMLEFDSDMLNLDASTLHARLKQSFMSAIQDQYEARSTALLKRKTACSKL